MYIQSGAYVKVYAHDGKKDDGTSYRFYSVGISSKNQEGVWRTSYMNCFFRKGTYIEDGTRIEIIKGWLTPTNDTKRVGLFIDEFKTSTQITEEAKEKYENDFEGFDGRVEITDDDLPF